MPIPALLLPLYPDIIDMLTLVRLYIKMPLER